MSMRTNPGLPSISDELFPADKANCCGQKGTEMRGTTLGLCAVGKSVEAPPLSSFLPTAHTLCPFSELSCLFPGATKTSLDSRWAPVLTRASVSSFGKGGRLEVFEDPLSSVSQRSCNPLGSPSYPATRPALLGSVQPALAGCQSPGGGDQPVGAKGLEPVAP